MNAFLDLVSVLVRRAPRLLVAGVILLTFLFGVLSSMATTEEGDFEDFATDTPAAQASDRIDELFADDGVELAQLFVVDRGGDVLSPSVLTQVQEIVEALSTDPAVTDVAARSSADAPVVSSYAAPVFAAAARQGIDLAEADDDTVDQLYTSGLQSLPAEQAGPLARLVGADAEDGDATAGSLVVVLDGTADEDALSAARAAVHAQAGTLDGGVDVYDFDFEALNEETNATVERELGMLLGVAFLLIIGILVAVYRSVSDVVASLLGLVMAITWTTGISFLLGPDVLGLTGGMSQMSTVIPILLVGLGVDYGIHLTMRAREEQVGGMAPDEAAGGAIRAVGAALALATMTTMVGFLTNLANPLPPLQDFGILAAAGVVCAFIVMTTFVPAVRLLVAQRRERRGRPPVGVRRNATQVGVLGRLSSSFSPVAVQRPGAVLLVAGAVTLAAAGAATQLSTEFSQTDFFPEDSRALEVVNIVTEQFGGGLDETTEVLVEGDVSSADATAALDVFVAGLADLPDVRIFEGRAQAEVATAPSGQAALVTVQTRAGEQASTLAADLDDLAGRTLAPAGLDAVPTSNQLVIDEILGELQASQLSGLAITLLASMALLAGAFFLRDRAPMLGVLAITSVGFTALWVLGVMVLLGIPFNVMTAMVSALAIGIGVPFGIHVVNRFLEDRRTHGDVGEAMRHTLGHTGGALIGSAVTTVAGFGVLMFASVPPMQQFGLVTAVTIALALVTSLTVLPAMLVLWDQRQRGPAEATVVGTEEAPPIREAEPVGSSH